MAVEGVGEPDRSLINKASIPQNPLEVNPPNHETTQSASSRRFDTPFTDLAGRCFLRGCLWVDLLQSWIRERQTQSDAKLDSAASWRYYFRVMGWRRSSLGAASCTAAAGCLIPVFTGNAYGAIVPLFFLLVILCVALRFGHVAGIVGTLCAALVFEVFLFQPTLSLAIHNSSARNHLISMVILGVCASELFGRRKAPAVYKP